MLLLGGAESLRKNQIIGRVTWLSPLPGGDQRRPIIRSKRACSGSNRRTVSTSPLRCQPRRAAFPFCPSPFFMKFRGPPGPGQQTTKTDRLPHLWDLLIDNVAGTTSLIGRIYS